MTASILVSCSPGERRVAVLSDGRLMDYAVDRPGAPDGVGALHRARIGAVVPALAGVFVVLDGSDGFLPDSEGAKGRSEGEVLGVRVTRAPQGGKGPRLTARLLPQESARICTGSPALIAEGPGAIERLASAWPEAAIVVDDPAVLAGLRQHLGGRLALADTAFDPETEAEVESLEQPGVTLPSGARFSISPTPALVAIDVDLGSQAGERGGKTAQHFAVNRAVLPELARQIRLRNLSGAILVDLAGLSSRRRVALGPALQEALANDPVKPRFLGFTQLGLAEIVRPRIHPPLYERLSGPHAAGLAALRRIARDLTADPRQFPALRASPSVVEALQRDPVALPELARRAGQPLVLRSDPALPGTSWIMERRHG